MTIGRARTGLKAFVEQLKHLLERVGGATYRDLERLTEKHERPLTRQTISNKFKIQSPPEWHFVDALLMGCELFAREPGRTALIPEDDDVTWTKDGPVFNRDWWRPRHDAVMAVVERQHEDNRFAAMAKLERDRRLLPRQLPALTRHFTGREGELDELRRLLGEDESGGEICVIHGAAGVGKTTLALSWAHRSAALFPDGQLYINLRGFDPEGVPVTAAQALRRFLEAFGVPLERVPASAEEQAGLLRSLVAGRKVLFVLDNAAGVDQVRPLLPGWSTCRVVVTSRVRLTGLAAREGASELLIPPFPATDAQVLIARHVRDVRPTQEPGALAQIARLCAYLPLALCVVGARAASRPELRLADVAAELTDATSALSALQTDDDIESNVRAAFSWSYRYLHAPAARLFRFLAVHPGPDFTAPAVASLLAVDIAQSRTLLDDLASVQLIDEPAAGRFALHDLLRLYATELGAAGDQDDDRRAANKRIDDHYLRSAHAASLAWDPHRDPVALPAPVAGIRPETFSARGSALKWLNEEFAVLLAIAQQALDANSQAWTWRILWCVSDYMHRQGHWTEGEPLILAALAAAAQANDVAGRARMERVLGRREFDRRSFSEARTHLETALTLFTETHDGAGQAHVHMDLAVLPPEEGETAAVSLGHAERARRCYRAAGSAQGEGNALNAAGWFTAQLGDLERAEALCREALAILEPLDDVAGLGPTLDSLGYIYVQQHRYDEADHYYKQALALFIRSDDPLMQADTLEHIGDNCLAADQPNQARIAYERAIPLFEQVEEYVRAEDIRIRLQPLNSDFPPGEADPAEHPSAVNGTRRPRSEN